jgi:DNA repair photolyase
MKNKYRVIYQPRGAAREYSELAVNLYKGCPHGCVYCYVPHCLRRKKEDFHSNFGPRKDIVNLIQKDLIEMKEAKDKRVVLFCFTCDPYPGDYEDNKYTQQALELFKAYNQPFQMLTKGGMKAARDFHLYKKTDAYATTLTLLDEKQSLKWEPDAPLPKSRIESLRKAKEKGITTWVSFEPVVDPEQVYQLYETTKEFVDLYKIGKLNHYKSDVDWKLFGETMIDKCETDGKDYLIKDALKAYLKE